MKTLIVIRTFYSLMVAINLSKNLWKEDDIDLLLTDCTSNSKGIYDRLKKIDIFHEVFYMSTKEFNRVKEKKIGRKIFLLKNYFEYYMRAEKYIEKHSTIRDRYDRLAVFQVNIDLELCVFNYCYDKNKDIELCLYEEAYSSYIAGSDSLKLFEEDIIDKLGVILHRPSMRKSIRKAYYYNPELIQYTPYFEVIRMPKLSQNLDTLLPVFNYIWDFDIDEKFLYRAIYCEDGAYLYGIDLDDEEIVTQISNIYGEDIAIKLHPRSKVDRFVNIQIQKLERNDVPIELYILNSNRKIQLITMYSSAVISPILCCGNEVQAIFVYECSQKKSLEAKKYKNRLNKILENLNENFIIIKKIEQLGTVEAKND